MCLRIDTVLELRKQGLLPHIISKQSVRQVSVVIVYFPDEETEAQTGDVPNITEGGSDRARTGTQSPSTSPQLHMNTFVHTVGTGDCGVIARGQCSEKWLPPESVHRKKATSNFPLTSNRKWRKSGNFI